ncbi:MAG: S8 family serine peptidase [Planctomycetaceae bacterium]|nr:S8 family serine peptidase [Planctomycetaceae bacterium]
MAKKARAGHAAPSQPESTVGTPDGFEAAGEATGKYLVLFREGAEAAALETLSNVTGLKEVASTADYEGALDLAEVAETPVIVFAKLGVAVVSGEPRQFSAMAVAAEDSPILAIEPEQIMRVLGDDAGPIGAGGAGMGVGLPPEYLRGYRDAVNDLYGRLTQGRAAGIAEPGIAETFVDDAVSTWGLKATRVLSSRFSGRGIRVAVLDTGFDLQHPDFLGHAVTGQSFIPNETVQDGQGHGTHCIGTSCGPQRPGVGPRYGIAFRAEIFAGKVLSNAGSGPDRSILAGIEWAITNGCRVVSMSLGSPVQAGEGFSQIYENVARRALAAGTLIIAAAGNESNRPGLIAAVDRPANCPSILAVAALDNQLQVAFFSNGGINPIGGGVDIAAPGVHVLSSVPMPTRTGFKSGTSMATPHVAGIAALWAEARNLSGGALASALTASARRLTLPSRDVGAGLVQAPQ